MRAPDHILSERLGEERLLLDLKREEYLSLNPTGTRIWEGLAAGLSVEEIVSHIEDEFETGKHQIENDVRNFMAELRAAGLLA